MNTVSGAAKNAKQPRGGFLSPSRFKKLEFDDGIVLNENENVHGSIIGTVVENLTSFVLGEPLEKAFATSLGGAEIAEKFTVVDATRFADIFINGIKGLDDQSIKYACMLVTFDVWTKNIIVADMAARHYEVFADADTIKNIKIMVNRSVTFFEKYGEIQAHGFQFRPVGMDDNAYFDWIESDDYEFGGYTKEVYNGEGDFLTSNALWDFKVLRTKITNKHTLQLLMYLVMGWHSGQDQYKNIELIGIFNPRINTAWVMYVDDIPNDTIHAIEKEIICYL